jgi:hypothetical protein
MRPDRDLDRELRDLGSDVEYPPTPDLARAVRQRLDEEPAPRRGWFHRPAARWAAVAAVVLISAVPALSPAARETVAGWFEGGQASTSGRVAGEAGEAAPADEETRVIESEAESRQDLAESGGSDIPESGGGSRPLGRDLGYGGRIPLREAETRLAGSELLLPRTRGLGEPDQVYAGGPSSEGGVVLLYRAGSGLPALGDTGVGLVLTEVPGSVESAYLRGGVLAVAGTERVSVGDGRGYWVPAGGRPSPALRRGDLPGNLLFSEREGLALRLAADLPKREMVRIAESVR